MHDLIVIGGGPAGLAATTYALDKRLDVLLIGTGLSGRAGDRQHYAGQSMPEELVGEEAVLSLQRHLAASAERIHTDTVLGLLRRDNVFHVQTEDIVRPAHAVIVATGVKPRMLGLPNELRYVGLGLSYSITTHAQAAIGRDVAVIGSNAQALRGVAELVQTARSIALIAPDPGQLGSVLGQRLRTHPKVRLLEGYHVQAIEGSRGAVHAIVVAQREEVQRIAVEAVFVDLGLVPNTQLVRHLVQIDTQGFIIVDAQNRTSLPGLFAAGDVTSAIGEQILIAIGEGARAAVSAYDYILAQRLPLSGAALRAT
jgi:thioredoxin reductase